VAGLKQIILECVQIAGPEGIPSGHLYAALTTKGVHLDVYETILESLISEGKIKRSHHLLTSI
jgi:hypothetical protein